MEKRDFFINSERIRFSRWKADDKKLALKLWGDFRVTRLFDSGRKFSDKKVLEKLKAEIQMDEKYGIQYWPIFLLENNEHIGACGLRPYNTETHIYEIGFHILPEFWRQGYAKEAALRVIRYAFEELFAVKLFAGHNPENKASEQILNKLNFKYSHDEFYQPTGLKHPSYFLSVDDYITGLKY